MIDVSEFFSSHTVDESKRISDKLLSEGVRYGMINDKLIKYENGTIKEVVMQDKIDAVALMGAYDDLLKVVNNHSLTAEQKHHEIFYGMIRDRIFDADGYLKSGYKPMISGTNVAEINHFVDYVSKNANILNKS